MPGRRARSLFGSTLHLALMLLALLGLGSCEEEKLYVEPHLENKSPHSKGRSAKDILQEGPFDVLNPLLVSIIEGRGGATLPNVPALDSAQARNTLIQYAKKDKMIDFKTALAIYDKPELHAMKYFNVAGIGGTADPQENNGLVMNAALVAAHRGAEDLQRFLFSKTPEGLNKFAGIVYTDALPWGVSAQVLHNNKTRQLLVRFNKELSTEIQLKLLATMAHELFAHQDGVVVHNEERAGNIAKALTLHNQMLWHPELFSAAKGGPVSAQDAWNLAPQIAFYNSLEGAALDIAGADQRVFPNTDPNAPNQAWVKAENYIELIDFDYGVKSPEGIRIGKEQ